MSSSKIAYICMSVKGGRCRTSYFIFVKDGDTVASRHINAFFKKNLSWCQICCDNGTYICELLSKNLHNIFFNKTIS